MDMVGDAPVEESAEEGGVRSVSVRFSEEELIALDRFFNGDGEMSDTIYDPLGRKFCIAAAKAGLLDEDA